MRQNARFIRKLPIPMEIKKEFPLSERVSATRLARVEEMRAILDGRDRRLMLIIGPCSADREDSVMDYVHRLVPVQEQVKDKLLIVPRVYTNKPRTNGAGYKGMLHQPDPSKKPDMLAGIIAIRRLHTRVVEETGFACADEMLYPEDHRYLSDILGYVAVGARSVENQQHRLVASGLDVPVGMKNPTGGDLSVMMNSIYAAMGDHMFLYRGWEVETYGNPYAHAILRGCVNERGESRPQLPLRGPGPAVQAVYGSSHQKPRLHRGLQPRQLRQAVSGADPHRQGSDALQAVLRRHQRPGQGPDDRELYPGRQPEDHRVHLRQEYHRRLSRLGKDPAADL